MNIPDLAAELAYWVPRMRLDDPPRPWSISMRYDADPRDPSNGKRVWGLNSRDVEARTARIVIRTPTNDAECLETLDTIAHELLHCLQADAGAPIHVEEGIVWTLAPLLTQLRLAEPARAESLCKAMTRMKAPIVARKGTRMDPDKIKAIIAALKEGNGDSALTLLEGLLMDAVAGGPVAPAAEEPPKVEEGGPPAPPALGTDKPAEKAPMYKNPAAAVKSPSGEASALPAAAVEALAKVQAQLADDRAAAVDAVLDTRPELTAEQRARFREIGVDKGVATLRKDLLIFAPAPTIKTENGARLGLSGAPRGGNGTPSKIARSGNQLLAKLFRVREDDPDNDGVEVPADGSALVTFSVVNAYAQVRAKAFAKAFGGKNGGAS